MLPCYSTIVGGLAWRDRVISAIHLSFHKSKETYLDYLDEVMCLGVSWVSVFLALLRCIQRSIIFLSDWVFSSSKVVIYIFYLLLLIFIFILSDGLMASL